MTMRNWVYTCKAGTNLRQAIRECDKSYRGYMMELYAISRCWNEILSYVKKHTEKFNNDDILDEILDELDQCSEYRQDLILAFADTDSVTTNHDIKNVEEIINDRLEILYSWCDYNDIFISL